jgi:hypothetical protein
VSEELEVDIVGSMKLLEKEITICVQGMVKEILKENGMEPKSQMEY